jgi:hypothetical protein
MSRVTSSPSGAPIIWDDDEEDLSASSPPVDCHESEEESFPLDADGAERSPGGAPILDPEVPSSDEELPPPPKPTTSPGGAPIID